LASIAGIYSFNFLADDASAFNEKRFVVFCGALISSAGVSSVS